MAGLFVPISIYNHDLAISSNNLIQLYPSRIITGTTGLDPSGIMELIHSLSTTVDGMITTSIPYADIRKFLWGELYKIITIPDSTTEEGAISIGDINFLSHDVSDGMVYSDIYVHVPAEQGEHTAVLQSVVDQDPTVPAIALDPETGLPMMVNSGRQNLRFNVIILYYNLYRVDPTQKDATMVPVVLDMPMGIYIPEEEVVVKVSTPELFGQGTAWATRICSRFVNSTSNSPISTSKSNEYSTLTKVLSEFGDLASTMDLILNKRCSPGSGETGMPYDDIKSYLEEFKQQKQVNVPYIKDGHWMVNGRDLGTAIESKDTGMISIEDLNSRINQLEETLKYLVYIIQNRP